MRHIAAPSAVYARTENTALPGSRLFTPRHNISACASRRMQMSDRDIAAQSNGIIYPPPKASPDTEIIQKIPLKSGINQASKRFCAPHNHATPVRTGQHAENTYTPQPTILSIMHRADGIHTQIKTCGTFPIFRPSIQKRQHHPGNCQETRSATSPIRHNAL